MARAVSQKTRQEWEGNLNAELSVAEAGAYLGDMLRALQQVSDSKNMRVLSAILEAAALEALRHTATDLTGRSKKSA